MQCINLFEENKKYSVMSFPTKNDWADYRANGIGGSDAACFMGCGFRSLRELWNEKKSGAKAFKGNVLTEYGNAAEPALRTLFQTKHPELDVQYMENTVLVDKQTPWRFYSPDGLLYETATGRKGILEIKTYLFRNRDEYFRKWGNDFNEDEKRIPNSYLFQVCHGLLVTGFDFVVFTAEIRYQDTAFTKIIERSFTRDEAQMALDALEKAEAEKWEKYFESNEMPPMEVIL